MSACTSLPAPVHDLHQMPVDRALLQRLRCLVCGCRAAGRMDVLAVCGAGGTPAPLPLKVLLTALPEALGQRPCFYERSAEALTFDERWVLAAIAATRRDDMDSLYFLIARRVPAHLRRGLVVLFRRAAETDDPTTQMISTTEDLPYVTTRS